ncbi:MAG: phosphatidate cytidylyltransferase, partial [Clostridia bacterium]|nr:phosphatidate cytidylyltransferase [Clostridia bacterium]
RNLDVKDFSKLLGNHGGMLDRFDGIMLNACFVSFIFTFIV